MKIPVIYHTLKPLVDIRIDNFNTATTDEEEMDHMKKRTFFYSTASSLIALN